MALRSSGTPDLEGLLDRVPPGEGDEMLIDVGGESGICVIGSTGIAVGWRSGVVAPGVPAGESVTAGMSDTRRLCPGPEEVPSAGEGAAGTGSLSAAERSMGDCVSVIVGSVVDVLVVRLTVKTSEVVGGLEAMTVITLPSLIS